MREKADSDLVRRQNRRLVLDALRQHGPLARIELGRHTGLSPASITSISSQLIADGILRGSRRTAHPVVPMRRGRPLTQLDINAESAHVVAVKISIDGVEMALADSRGTIIDRSISRIATYDAEPARFGKAVAAEIARQLRQVARAGAQGGAHRRRGSGRGRFAGRHHRLEPGLPWTEHSGGAACCRTSSAFPARSPMMPT